MSEKKDLAPVEDHTVYVHGQITYVPHYRFPHIYVGPGYPKHNAKHWGAKELESLGAKPQKAMLWQRPKHTFQEAA